MPAKAINLLPQKAFDTTILGKILRWSLTYGRYIIISTEIIVLLAFIYRFSLDRKITDLNEDIEQKSAIVKANLGFEQRFRNLQKRTTQISTLFTNEDLLTQILAHLQEITPAGVHFTVFSLSDNAILISGIANSSPTLALFLENLKVSPYLTQVSVTSLSKTSTGTGEANFQLQANVKLPTN